MKWGTLASQAPAAGRWRCVAKNLAESNAWSGVPPCPYRRAGIEINLSHLFGSSKLPNWQRTELPVARSAPHQQAMLLTNDDILVCRALHVAVRPGVGTVLNSLPVGGSHYPKHGPSYVVRFELSPNPVFPFLASRRQGLRSRLTECNT